MLESPAEAIDRVRAALGNPRIVFSEPSDVASVMRRGLGTGEVLVAVLVDTTDDAKRIQEAMASTGADIERLPVDGGVLVLAHRTAAERPFDARPVQGATMRDLDDELRARWIHFGERLPKFAIPDFGNAEERALGRIGVLVADGRIWRPTVAAMVLAGLRPELWLPGATVDQVVDGRTTRTHGNLGQLLEAGVPDPADACVAREALLNAVLHRDWSDDAPIVVELVGHRLVVHNPGNLARRNLLLLRLAVALGVTPGRRCGLRRIGAHLQGLGFPTWSLVEGEGRIRFAADVPRRRTVQTPARSAPPPNPPRPPVPPAAEAPRSDRGATVLALLRARGQLTTREIATELDCSRPVVGKLLTTLVAEGRVRMTAEGRSPFQAYELVDRD